MTEWWNTLTLDQLSTEQWEALCDGCGRCCLHKLEDEETGEYHFTRIRCRLLDDKTSRCSDYANRLEKVADCVKLSPENTADFQWLPSTCAYRLRANGKALHDWHPLVSGDPESVRRAGMTVRNNTVSDEDVRFYEYEDHIITWID